MACGKGNINFDTNIDRLAGFYVSLYQEPCCKGLAQILMNNKQVESYTRIWKHQTVLKTTIKGVIRN